ncbi:hypothetical protein D0T11_05250 [Hymenobacter rubripertinctus]|uniref:Uncharacterized protein n=1 Tax=Hymenobacter rubripertinctus TaxID=2029981 RepID=A0A418R4M5_9BACT|nr:hypothetical protein D0T11_05250 [Hymenobacter rubripertinctus]
MLDLCIEHFFVQGFELHLMHPQLLHQPLAFVRVSSSAGRASRRRRCSARARRSSRGWSGGRDGKPAVELDMDGGAG